jgi:CheY-like chemotaxis protein
MIQGELAEKSPRFVLLAPPSHCARTKTWRLAGFEACVQKPVRRSDLDECVAAILASASAGNGASLAAKGSAAAPRAADNAAGHKGLLGLRVLIVEDNLVNQRVAERMLEKLGCEVSIADDGRQALASCAATRFDLVMMDCQMPVLDGFAATEELRRRERDEGRARTPVIALTANAIQGDRDRCLAAGMDDYVAKPIVRDELVAALLRWKPPHVS